MRLAHHLIRHPSGMWHFRLRVPTDLREAFGLQVIKRSLRTRDVTEARQWAYSFGAQYAQLFATARQLGKGMGGKRWDDDAVAKVMAGLGGRVSGWEVETPDGFKLRTQDSPSDHAAGLEALEAYFSAQRKRAAAAIQVAVPPPSPVIQSTAPTLADAILTYNESEGPNLKPDTWEQRKRACVSFAKVIGGKVRVDEVTRPMASSWASDLQRSGLAKRYVANMVSHVAQIFEAQIRAGHIASGINPVKGVVIIRKSEKKALRDSGHAWEALPEEALKRIYDPENLKRIKGIHVRWGALIGLYTGARVSEVAQIFLRDFVELDGVRCVRITNDSDGQSVKTDNSKRLVPLHPDLLKLGLWERVVSLRAQGHGRLLRKTCMSSTPRRKLPLKRSMKPFCMGRPGSMKSSVMPLRSAHSASASAMNSGPLSRRSLAG